MASKAGLVECVCKTNNDVAETTNFLLVLLASWLSGIDWLECWFEQ